VIITSNNEKELPDAFLRRCVFHFIDFPDRDFMRRVVNVHHPDLGETLVDQTLQAFFQLRTTRGLRKRPSTSELIDWIAVLKKAGVAEVKLDRALPFLGTLLKKEQDVVAYADAARGRQEVPLLTHQASCSSNSSTSFARTRCRSACKKPSPWRARCPSDFTTVPSMASTSSHAPS
jgi:MoxR-like ATPase